MGKFSVGDKDCTDKDKDIKERYVPKCNKGMGNHRERSLWDNLPTCQVKGIKSNHQWKCYKCMGSGSTVNG